VFNPNNVQLKPSLPLAFILGLPFLSTCVLFTLVRLPLAYTLLLLLLACLCAYYFLTRYASLASQHSIIEVASNGKQFYLTDLSGRRYLAEPRGSAIVHPLFCIVSFSCEMLEEKQSTQQEPALPVHVRLAEESRLATFVEALCQRSQQVLNRKDIRHVIICRYNVSNLNEYRCLRVALKFR